MRNAASWAGVPMEFVAAMPFGASEELQRLIVARDRWIIGDRKSGMES